MYWVVRVFIVLGSLVPLTLLAVTLTYPNGTAIERRQYYRQHMPLAQEQYECITDPLGAWDRNLHVCVENEAVPWQDRFLLMEDDAFRMYRTHGQYAVMLIALTVLSASMSAACLLTPFPLPLSVDAALILLHTLVFGVALGIVWLPEHLSQQRMHCSHQAIPVAVNWQGAHGSWGVGSWLVLNGLVWILTVCLMLGVGFLHW